MMMEGASDRVETDADLESSKLEEKLSETKSEPKVGDNLESTGLMLSCDLEHKYVRSDAILGEKIINHNRNLRRYSSPLMAQCRVLRMKKTLMPPSDQNMMLRLQQHRKKKW